MTYPVVVTSRVRLASSPAQLWPLLTDTDRANRLVLGKAGFRFRPIDGNAGGSARFLVETRIAGLPLRYEEAPFEWEVERRFSVHRRMRSGPLEEYRFGVTLDPVGEGTDATMRLEVVPRHWTLAPLARFQGQRIVTGMTDLARKLDAHLVAAAPSPFERPVAPVDETRLAHVRQELERRPLAPEIVATLVRLLREAPDAELVRIRPFELADRHGLEPLETLRAMLHATTAGALELRWALVCPSCRTANDHVSALAELGTESHCQLCDLSYELELDRSVEATFRVHGSIRAVDDQLFCIGGPFRTPHVLVQAVLPSRGERVLPVPSEPGRYRLFARGGAVAALEVATDGAAQASITLEARFAPGELRLRPEARLRVVNGRAEELHVKLERLGYAMLAATAQQVTMLPEFRRFFSKDLLKPRTPLRVATATILFSDLTGSTALYTAAGDAAAFRLVDDHFDVLRRAIGAEEGVVVKTMGDAVMAAFRDPRAAYRAAVAGLGAFEEFRARAPHGELTGLKLGLFDGPCYVVTANEALDYFGQTVNAASRVQHCAGSGELVLPADLWERLSDADRARVALLEPFETHVKGVADALRLVRVRLPP